MKKSVIIALGVVLIMAIGGFAMANGYNDMVLKRENVESSLSDLDVMLQRRADLIPNLVNTVKGYATHETEIIEKITEARSKLLNANTVEEKAQANSELSSSLNALLVVVENYPDLKSSENFKQLADELAGTENRVAIARKDYNDTAKIFNTTIKKFPNNVLARLFGFEHAAYFEATEKSSEAPNVNFE